MLHRNLEQSLRKWTIHFTEGARKLFWFTSSQVSGSKAHLYHLSSQHDFHHALNQPICLRLIAMLNFNCSKPRIYRFPESPWSFHSPRKAISCAASKLASPWTTTKYVQSRRVSKNRQPTIKHGIACSWHWSNHVSVEFHALILGNCKSLLRKHINGQPGN